MKSYVNHLQGLYSAMFSDVAEQFPSLRHDCERDASRLLSLIESRGISYLMIDLPDMGKHFDRCLSHGRLIPSGLAGQRPYRKGGVIPRLFKGLLSRVFDEFGVLRTDSDVACIRILRQLYYAAKKMKVTCDDSRTWEHVHEFFETDRKVRSPSLDWDDDEPRLQLLQYLHLGDTCSSSPAPLFGICDTSFTDAEGSLSTPRYGTLEAIQRTADIVSATLGGFIPSEWRAKHGPGAVADQRHTQFKYDFPSWPAKLERVFPMADFGFPNYDAWVRFSTGDAASKLFSSNEPASKLICVPKTLKGPRLIAAEPVSHQWCQQMILDFLTSRLVKTPISSSIHFRDQRENQDFARRASHTQSHVTVDLSSASDRLSCWVVERIFRRNPSLVEALHSSRTRWVANAIDKKSPSAHRLRKFSCMGSACTFPVQSYVFTILAIGCLLESRKQSITIKAIRKASKEVRVFGDDIIIPVDGWELLQGVLGHLGLKVNLQKTYDQGNFRESCGLDAFDGTCVTPVYSMTYPDVSRPESILSCVASSNNFFQRGWLRTAQYIKSRVDRLNRFRFLSVPLGSGAFGWYSFDADKDNTFERRWNPRLHRTEVRVDIPQGRSSRIQQNSDGQLLQYFTVSHRRPQFIEGERIGVVGRASTVIRRRWVALGA